MHKLNPQDAFQICTSSSTSKKKSSRSTLISFAPFLLAYLLVVKLTC